MISNYFLFCNIYVTEEAVVAVVGGLPTATSTASSVIYIKLLVYLSVIFSGISIRLFLFMTCNFFYRFEV